MTKIILLLTILFFIGAACAFAIGDTPTELSVTACAHSAVDPQTIADNGNPVFTIPGVVNDQCQSATTTVPTVTQTLTETVTQTQTVTQPQTVTVTAPTTTATPPPAVEQANLWVNTTAGAAPARCATACAYDSTKAFGTFLSACKAAQSGDLVLVQGGNYPGEELGSCVGHAGFVQNVVFRAAKDQSVVMTSELSIRATVAQKVAHLEFANMKLQDFYVLNTQNIIFRNDTLQFFFVRASDSVSILGGSVGGVNTGVSPTIGTTGSGGTPSTNVLVDGVFFHDVTRTATGTHLECLFIQESDHVTVRNNEFVRCDTISVFANPIFGGAVSNLDFVQNVVHTPTDHASVNNVCSGCVAFNLGTNGTHTNIHILFNSFGGSIAMAPQPADSGYLVEGNVGHLTGGTTGTCVAVNYKYNVFDNAACDPTDRKAPLGYVAPETADETGTDFHLAPGAAAVAFVPTSFCSTTCPNADKDGLARPNPAHPSALNAGAFENR